MLKRWIAGKGIVRWRMVSGKLGLSVGVCEKVIGALVVRREGWLSVVGEGGLCLWLWLWFWFWLWFWWRSIGGECSLAVTAAECECKCECE